MYDLSIFVPLTRICFVSWLVLRKCPQKHLQWLSTGHLLTKVPRLLLKSSFTSRGQVSRSKLAKRTMPQAEKCTYIQLSSFAGRPLPTSTSSPSPKLCKTWSDCSCPRGPSNQISSTSCINGACSCNNPIINFMDNTLIDGVAKVANSPVFQAMGQVFETFADVEEVAADVAGIFGPEAKAAAKVTVIFISNRIAQLNLFFLSSH